MSHARFQKQLREKARREKAAAKVERRDQRRAEAAEAAPSDVAVDEAILIARLAELHERFAAGQLEFDEFAEAKAELTEQLLNS